MSSQRLPSTSLSGSTANDLEFSSSGETDDYIDSDHSSIDDHHTHERIEAWLEGLPDPPEFADLNTTEPPQEHVSREEHANRAGSPSSMGYRSHDGSESSADTRTSSGSAGSYYPRVYKDKLTDGPDPSDDDRNLADDELDKLNESREEALRRIKRIFSRGLKEVDPLLYEKSAFPFRFR